jgi:hypothetical protein
MATGTDYEWDVNNVHEDGTSYISRSISFIPSPLCKLTEAFGLSSSKSWYPHYINTEENLDYVGEMPDVSYYGVDQMGEAERKDLLTCYEDQKSLVFDNKSVLEQYCQDNVTVLRQECQAFRREFKDTGHIQVFQESYTIASACNKVFRKQFLQPDTIGLIPTGGYSGNVKYSKKAVMWIVYKEQTDGCNILHGRNGREYRLPELPHRLLFSRSYLPIFP